jgi:hypothetical protein
MEWQAFRYYNKNFIVDFWFWQIVLFNPIIETKSCQ